MRPPAWMTITEPDDCGNAKVTIRMTPKEHNPMSNRHGTINLDALEELKMSTLANIHRAEERGDDASVAVLEGRYFGISLVGQLIRTPTVTPESHESPRSAAETPETGVGCPEGAETGERGSNRPAWECDGGYQCPASEHILGCFRSKPEHNAGLRDLCRGFGGEPLRPPSPFPPPPPQMTVEQVIADLRERLTRTMRALDADASRAMGRAESASLSAKASGVALALDYLRAYS